MAADGGVTQRPKPSMARNPHGPQVEMRQPAYPRAKPTAAGLGLDLAGLEWQRSGTGSGSFEVAFVAGQNANLRAAAGQAADAEHGRETGSNCPMIEWVLLRVADDPVGRVLVFDRNEWLCFLDGAVRGEFDWRLGLTGVRGNRCQFNLSSTGASPATSWPGGSVCSGRDALRAASEPITGNRL
jgi:hypothetical protein